MQKTNTLTSLNKKAVAKTSSKTSKELNGKTKGQQNQPTIEVSKFEGHPGMKFIRGSNPTSAEFRKFVTLLYKGIYYSLNNLKGPSQEYIKKKGILLPQSSSTGTSLHIQESKKKFLMLDLDETLIHSVFTNEKTDVKFTCKGDEFKFNVRPHCLEFLTNMSQYYNLYVFTAGTHDYAEPIITYLNQKRKTIQGFLHRKNCMQTQNGFFIKDLRIIQNRELKDIVMIDNLAHSFGLQPTNGIPILDFIDNSQDQELIALQQTLIELSTVNDVREYLEKNIQIKNVLDHDENVFTTVPQDTIKS